MLYWFSRCWPLRCNFTSGDVTLFLDVSFYQQTKFCNYHSICGWHITISGFEIQTSAILEFYFRFHFGPHHRSRHVIAKFASICEILSKSECPRQRNYVMLIFKMADLRHLEFYGSNNGFFEKPVYDFLYVVNGDRSTKLLSFWENRVFAFRQQTDRHTERQTDKQVDRPIALSRSQ